MARIHLTLLIITVIGGSNSGSAQGADRPGGGGPAPDVDLHVIGMAPVDNPIYDTGTALEGLYMALEMINSRPDILPGYRLIMDFENSKCATGPGIDALYRQLYNPPAKLMVIGAGCSVVCQPATEGSVLWNLTTVSFTCTSPALSDRKRYPRFFRTVIPDSSKVPLVFHIMNMYNWTKVAVINQAFEIFSASADKFMDVMSTYNKTLVTSEVFQSDSRVQIQKLKAKDTRIILAGFYNVIGPDVMCNAYKAGLYKPKVVWLLPNWFPLMWFLDPATPVSCSEEELLQVIEGTIYLGQSLVNPFNDTSFSGLTFNEMKAIFTARTVNMTHHGTEFFSSSFFDSGWVAAMALHRTMEKLNGSSKTLADFTYSDMEMADMITESVKETDFMGVQGKMKFDEEGNPSSIMSIEQQQGLERPVVGYYRPDLGSVIWQNGGLKWPGGKAPRDSSVVTYERLYVSTAILAAMFTLTALGILAAVGFLVFNVGFRKRRVIKMSAPNINNIILAGCIFAYATVLFVDSSKSWLSVQSICIVRLVTFILGFSLTYGGLFSKTWRVHVILTSSMKTGQRTVIKDSRLFVYILVLVSVNMLILVIWMAVDPFKVITKDLPSRISKDDDYVEIVPQIDVCESRYQLYFTGALYVVQGLVLAFGAFLAWETKKIKVEALNDSKLISTCIYNIMLFSVLGVAIGYVIENNVDATYGFTSAFIIAGTTLTAWIVFIPKIMAVKRGEEMVGPLTEVGASTGQERSVVTVAQPPGQSTGN